MYLVVVVVAVAVMLQDTCQLGGRGGLPANFTGYQTAIRMPWTSVTDVGWIDPIAKQQKAAFIYPVPWDLLPYTCP